MPWSTRQLADLAGTTLRTVRHYHHLGLLDLPARGSNGYKQYDAEHLERLLRIRQLVQLGLTLPQVERALGPGGLNATELLDLDRRLATTVQRLQAARNDLAALVGDSDGDVHHFGRDPDELTDLNLAPADDSFLAVLTAVVSPETKKAYLAAVRATAEDPILVELDTLDPDADEKTRARLAEELTTHVTKLHAASPILQDILTGTTLPRTSAQRALNHTVHDVYNPAQVDVIRRVATSVRQV